MRSVLTRLLTVTLVAAALSACGRESDHEPVAPATADLPAGLTAYVDQGRVDRVGRTSFVRLVNDDDTTVAVTRAEISSDRFDEVVWTGEKEVVNEGDLRFTMPPGRCGTGSDADVVLTYRVGDGPLVVSTTRATDRYGAIGLLLDRDCARQRMEEAADVVIGDDRVVGAGLRSVFELPVTFAATGTHEEVAFAGFEGTVLFRTVPPTPVWESVDPVPLVAGAREETVLRLVPTRCDPHALAEDKVGTLLGVHVVEPGLTDGASYFLPISDETRADLRRFFSTHCGL